MNRLMRMQLYLETGSMGISLPIRIRINGHILPVTTLEGNAAAGAKFLGLVHIRSVVHSLDLLGSEVSDWQLDAIRCEFFMDDGSSLESELLNQFLPAGAALDIWNAQSPFQV